MDQKLYTFLTLCQTMNYRVAAEQLHLSQPAVTKQIQALEQELQTKLFSFDGRMLHKTESCLLFERYAISQQHLYEGQLQQNEIRFLPAQDGAFRGHLRQKQPAVRQTCARG